MFDIITKRDCFMVPPNDKKQTNNSLTCTGTLAIYRFTNYIIHYTFCNNITCKQSRV